MKLLLVLVAALLLGSSLSLITAQHRARSLFVDLERAQQQARALTADGDRLRVELGRAAQPASIEVAAKQIGLRPVDAKNIVFLQAANEPAAATAATNQEAK